MASIDIPGYDGAPASHMPGDMITEVMRSDSVSSAGSADDEPVLLYVKSGPDGVSYGACPFCQSAVLMLLTKVSDGFVLIANKDSSTNNLKLQVGFSHCILIFCIVFLSPHSNLGNVVGSRSTVFLTPIFLGLCLEQI